MHTIEKNKKYSNVTTGQVVIISDIYTDSQGNELVDYRKIMFRAGIDNYSRNFTKFKYVMLRTYKPYEG